MWKFIDGGAFKRIGGGFRFAGISEDGLLAIDWETEKGKSERYTINIEILEHSDQKVNITSGYPKSIEHRITERNNMSLLVLDLTVGILLLDVPQ